MIVAIVKNSIHIALCVCHSLNSAPPKHQSWIRPCYEGTQQDLTDEKERLPGYAGLRGIKGSLLMIDPYFHCFSLNKSL